MANYLVTGSKGFIGNKLTPLLPYAREIDLKDGKNLITCPLPNEFDIDVIYHLAAQTSVENSITDPMYEIDSMKMIVRLVQEYPNAKIIFTQSAASLDITSPYGFFKKSVADYLKTFHSNYVICTLPNVYGGGNGVVDIFKGKEVVEIYGDGKQVRDFVHVDDIVKGLILAQDWECGEYLMGSGTGTTVLELAQGKRIKYLPERKEIRESILPNTTPNWEPIIKVKDYLCQI